MKYNIQKIKVIVIFYLRLRNEFQTFPAKNHATNYVVDLLGQPIRGLVFCRKNGWIHFLISDKKILALEFRKVDL